MTFILALLFSAANAFAGSSTPMPFSVDTNAFSVTANEDRDQDCMSDLVEYQLAKRFSPYLVFDSREDALRQNEPLGLFQVTPYPRLKRPDCKVPKQVRLEWVFLFADDGGYVTSKICRDSHFGDNERNRLTFDVSPDGRTFTLREVENDAYLWPHDEVDFFLGTHPTLFLSAGKHHSYFNTRFNGKSSPYSKWGCREGVNGKGRRVLPPAESDAAPNHIHNVGEPDAHPEDFFVGDLTNFEFWGCHAWSDRPFCGGHMGGCGESSPLKSMWLK